MQIRLRKLLIISSSILVSAGMLFLVYSWVRSASLPSEDKVDLAYGKLPLNFEKNQGQTHASVSFLSRGIGYSLFLKPDEAVLSLASQASEKAPASKAAVLRMQLKGGNAAAPVEGGGLQAGHSNYFIGNKPEAWRTNVPLYAKVRFSEVYPGVDMVYYGQQRQLEYDFVVAPGADPAQIRLAFAGARKLTLDPQGALHIGVEGKELVFQAPLIYQGAKEHPRSVDGRFQLHDGNEVSFQVAAYDKTQALIIDPVLSYSSYLGGSNDDRGNSIKVDASGNAYITGYAVSPDFPTASPYQAVRSGTDDAIVTKVNAAGTGLVYSTYLGGTGSETGYGIAVDGAGSVYVVGNTSSTNFPTLGPVQAANAGTNDAFITKLNPAGSALVYSTYLGGTAWDGAYSVAVDSSNNAYVVGATASTAFPRVAAIQNTYGGAPFDAFITKVNAAGTAWTYSTYLGGTLEDEAMGVALDNAGNAYITGYTASTAFPRVAAIQNVYGGGTFDAFVTKVNAAGTAWTYSSYLGGSLDDDGYGIAVDPASGVAYIVGMTLSTNFPTVSAYQASSGGGGAADAFVTQVNAGGTAWVHSSYLGGSNSDNAQGVALDSLGNVYITGYTSSTNFPIISAVQATLAGGVNSDAFVTKLMANGTTLDYSTYLGGAQGDSAYGIAVDSAGNAYITGVTGSNDFRTANPFQSFNIAATLCGFFAKISQPAAGGSNTVTPTLTISATVTPTPTSVPICALEVSSGNVSLAAGTYSFCYVHVYSGATLDIYGAVTITVSGDFVVDSGGTVWGQGRGSAGGAALTVGTGLGPGGAGSATKGAGGGGHGGAGGTCGGGGGTGGIANDQPTAPMAPGSGGGGAASPGIAGGAYLGVYALTGRATLNGSFQFQGGSPVGGAAASGGGGGGGGGILVKALIIEGNGTVDASGGGGRTGTTNGGGGGGGGRINLCYSSVYTFTGSALVTGGPLGSGGSQAAPGAAGTIYSCASTSLPPAMTFTRTTTPTSTMTPTVTLTVTLTPFNGSPTHTASITPSFSATMTPVNTPTSVVPSGGPCGEGYRFGEMVEDTSNSDPNTSLTKLTATKFYLWEAASIHGLWGSIATAGAAQTLMGLYTDNGLGTQPSLSITASSSHVATVGWNYYPLSTPVTLQPGYYWITYQGASSGTFIKLRTTGGSTWATTGAVPFGSWPSSFPAGSGSPWVQQFNAAYCPLRLYNGNRNHAEAVWLFPLDDPTAKLSQRFTQKGNRTVTQVQVPVYSVASPPIYRVSLQADNGAGKPTGTILGSGTFTPAAAGWLTVAISPSVPLTDGVTYHQVIDWSSGQCTGTKDATFRSGGSPPAPKYPIDQSDNLASGVLVAPLGTWESRPYGNLFLLGDASGWWGQGYDQVRAFTVNGNNTSGTTTDDLVTTEFFKTLGSNWNASHVAVFVSGCASVSPGADLSYTLFDMTFGVTVTSGVLIANGSAPLTPTWVEAALPGTISMIAGRNYRLALRAPNIAAPGYTIISMAQSAAGSPYQDLGFEGVNAWASFSTNNGASETTYMTDDLPFLWRDAPPLPTATPTSTTTPTYTASPTATASASPTQTPFLGTSTHTPSPTMTVTMTTTPTPTSTPVLGPCGTGTYYMGYSGSGTTAQDMDGLTLGATLFEMPEDGTLWSLNVKVNLTSGGQARLAVYARSGSAPGALLYQTASFAPVVGWNRVPMPGGYALAKGDYYLAVQTSNGGGVYVERDSAQPNGTGYTAGFAYNNFPDPFSGSAPGPDTKRWSLYAEYCPDYVWTGSRAEGGAPPLARSLTASAQISAIRFTARASKTTNRLFFRVQTATAPPLFRVGLQADNAGLPSGTWLGSATLTPAAAWNYVTVPVALTAGTRYHLVIKYESGTIGASNFISINGGAGHTWRAMPDNEQVDPALDFETFNGVGWNDDDTMPVFMIEHSDLSLFGQPYFNTIGNRVSGAGTVPITDDRVHSQVVRLSFTAQVDRLAAWVLSPNPAAGGALNYYITDLAQSVTYASGVMVANGAALGLSRWAEVTLTPLTLNSGQDYRVLFTCPTIALANSYQILSIFTDNTQTEAMNDTWGGQTSRDMYSLNGGAAWTSYPEEDSGVRFRISGSGPTATPTLTPTPTQTSTATPSRTASPTSTATPTQTRTSTATPSLSASPSSTVTPTLTVTSCILDVTGTQTLFTGTYNYCQVHVHSGATLNFQGVITMYVAGDFIVDSTGLVNGNGGMGLGGAPNGGAAGPGGGGPGGPGGHGGAGGGHGGVGGNGSANVGFGAFHDSAIGPTAVGGGGGGGNGAQGGAGGGGGYALIVSATGQALINGTVRAIGGQGMSNTGANCGAGGAGAGGTINIYATDILGGGTGSVNVLGGTAGNCAFSPCGGGGAGGGGRIDLCAAAVYGFTGTLGYGTGNNSFGSLGSGFMGATGSFHNCGVAPTATVTRTVTPTTTPTPTMTTVPTEQRWYLENLASGSGAAVNLLDPALPLAYNYTSISSNCVPVDYADWASGPWGQNGIAAGTWTFRFFGGAFAAGSVWKVSVYEYAGSLPGNLLFTATGAMNTAPVAMDSFSAAEPAFAFPASSRLRVLLQQWDQACGGFVGSVCYWGGPGYDASIDIPIAPAPTATPTATSTSSATTTPTLTGTVTASETPSSSATGSSTATSTFSATATPTATPSPSATATPTGTPTASSTLTPTPTSTGTASETPSFSATATASATLSATATQSSSATATPSATGTVTLTATESATLTASATQSSTATATPTYSATGTPSATATPSESATLTATLTASATLSASATQSSTATETPTESVTASPSSSATLTASASTTATGTESATLTASATQSPTATATPSESASATPSVTETFSETGTATATPTASATLTASATQSSTPTATPSYSATGTSSATGTATETATVTATVTESATLTESATQSSTPTATPSESASATPSATETFTGTGTLTATPTVSATPSSTVTPSESATVTATPTESATLTATATESQTASATPSSSATATFSATATPSESATATATPSPSATPTASATATPTLSATATPSSSATATDSPTATATTSATATPSATATASSSATSTASSTATPTPSATATASSSATPTASATATPTPSATVTPSATATASSSATATASATGTPTASVTVTPSATATASSTATPSSSATLTASSTVTATATPTATPSSSATATASATATVTRSVTATQSPTATVTGTYSATGTATATVTLSATATPSSSATPSASATASPTASPTPSSSATRTSTGTQTATFTTTPTLSSSATRTSSSTPTPTSSVTPPSSPTETPTATPTRTISTTFSATATPTATATCTPTVTLANSSTFSPTRTQTPLPTVSHTPTCTATQSPYQSPTQSPTVTPTWTISDTPLPTGTPNVPASLSSNVFKPQLGQPLRISIKAPQTGRVRVHVFNVAGEKVRSPFEADVQADVTVEALWDGRNDYGEPCGSGVYLVSVQGAGIRSLKKVILLK